MCYFYVTGIEGIGYMNTRISAAIFAPILAENPARWNKNFDATAAGLSAAEKTNIAATMEKLDREKAEAFAVIDAIVCDILPWQMDS